MSDAGSASAKSPERSSSSGGWIAAALILFVLASLTAFTQAPYSRLEGRALAGWLFYPVERNAADRLPTLFGELNAVAVSTDGQRAVAVGENGAILTTSNWGKNWTARNSGGNRSLLGVSISADGQHALAVGIFGTILVSRDGGQRWEMRASGTIGGLQSVSLAGDGQTAVAVGLSGTIVTSNNAGQTWNVQTSGTTSRLSSVSLSADGQRAVAVGEGGVILASRNGGQSWASQTNGITNSLSSVSLSGDGQRAVAVGEGGVILTSSNGGQSWASQTNGTIQVASGVSLSGDGQRAVAVGEGGVILASRDSGQSWASQTNVITNALSKISLSGDGRRAVVVGDEGTILTSSNGGLSSVSLSGDGQRAIAVGDDGTILTSSNGGQSWASQFRNDAYPIEDVSLSADGQRAVAVGIGGLIFIGSNGGQSWATQSSGANKWHRGVSLSSDAQHVVAVGIAGLILTSSNGGQSWVTQTSDTTNHLVDVSLSGDGQRAVAVGWGGVILTSSNGGQSWVTQTSGTTKKLSGVSLSGDGQRAVAVDEGGVILASSNGGQSWVTQTSDTTNHLVDVSLSGDGQRAVAVGWGGVILTSSNGGQSWATQTSGTTKKLSGVSLSGDGQRAVAVGEGGVILTSSNGGQSWATQTSGTTKNLSSVSLSGDGQRAIAVGIDSVILASRDGGQSWVRQSYTHILDYARYPAPWYYLTILLCAYFLYRGASGAASQRQTGAAAIAASDSPTISIDQDRLEFAPLARGISRFLRNANTDAPLTLAITGEWGSGKSSLMGQVCDDLRANRWRPVGFNAWHHQNEEQLLAALLVAVRESGVPSIVSLAGFGFRLRLLRIRAQQRLLATLFIVTLASLIIAFVASHRDAAEWQGIAAMMKAFKGKDGAPDLTALQSILPILGTIGVVVAMGRTIKAFGVDPAVLLSSTMAKFRLKDASAQTSFRIRFAEQFGDVTKALAYPMVIVIDDLDRCKPETVLDVMEAVNFLTSSGKCFVIFGMATQRVQAALALSFKEIAGELVQFDGAGSDERQRRHDYARDYLEKLINIEILVPDRTDLPPSHLLEEREPAAFDWLSRLIAEVKRWWLLVPVGGAIAAGLWLASLIALLEAPKSPVTPVEQVVKTVPRAATTPAVSTQAQRPIALAPPANQAPVMIPGNDRNISPLWFLLAFAGLLIIGAALLLHWCQRQKLIVQDTQAFRDATRIWTPIATFTRNSPRSIKRFGNRIRYLAMLQQGERFDEPPMARQLRAQVSHGLTKLSNLLKRRSENVNTTFPTPINDTERALALSEHRIVALGAMHAHFGDKWKNWVLNLLPNHAADQLSQHPSGIGTLLNNAIESYRTIPGASWPPSADELDAFERSLKGVRLPGDGRTFDTSAVDEPLSPTSSIDPDIVSKSKAVWPRKRVPDVPDKK